MAFRSGFANLAFLALLPVAAAAAETPATAPAAAPQPAAPPRSVFEIGNDGGATHLQSLLQCPASLDGYTRDDLRVYDGIGFDVSCNYHGPQSDVTIYLTRRAPALLAPAFRKRQAADRQAFSRCRGARRRHGAAARPGLEGGVLCPRRAAPSSTTC